MQTQVKKPAGGGGFMFYLLSGLEVAAGKLVMLGFPPRRSLLRGSKRWRAVCDSPNHEEGDYRKTLKLTLIAQQSMFCKHSLWFHVLEVQSLIAVTFIYILCKLMCCLFVSGAGLSGRQMHRTQGVFNHTEDYVLLPDERTISLCCWDSRTAERKNLLSLGHNNIVRCIVHSPTNPGFMTCSDDFRARFWYRRTTTDWQTVIQYIMQQKPWCHNILVTSV